MSNRVHNTPLEKAIYEVICNEDIFEIGFKGTSAEIAEIVKPYIDLHLLIGEDFENNVRQVLQRNNCIRNKYITNSKSELQEHPDDYYNDLIKRDIATIKINLVKPHGRNLYLFGCKVDDIVSPVDKDLGWLP